MLSRILLASAALVFVGMLAMRATGADQGKSSQGCCGMNMPDASAAPAKDTQSTGCPMMAQPVESDRCPMAAKPTTRPAAAKSVYTCPMHPEVVASKAGKCPKCGMNLVAKQEKPKGDQKPADKSDAGDSSSGHTHNH